MRELTIWDILFYLSLIVIFIWLILKSTGVIQTPFWLEYGVPLASLAISFLTFYQTILSKLNKLTINLVLVKNDVGILKKDVIFLKDDVEILKEDVKYLKEKTK